MAIREGNGVPLGSMGPAAATFEIDRLHALCREKDAALASAHEMNERLVAQLDTMLHLAPCQEGWCLYCGERVGNILPVNDRHHSESCPIPKSRALLQSLQANKGDGSNG